MGPRWLRSRKHELCAAHMVGEFMSVVFDLFAVEKPSAESVMARPILARVAITDDKVRTERWLPLGVDPIHASAFPASFWSVQKQGIVRDGFALCEWHSNEPSFRTVGCDEIVGLDTDNLYTATKVESVLDGVEGGARWSDVCWRAEDRRHFERLWARLGCERLDSVDR